MIEKYIIKNNQNISEKNKAIWNLFGSTAVAFASMLLTYLTIRIIGENKGGVFAIALTLAQMFVHISYFEMRTYQITDAKNEFAFADYHRLKVFVSLAMIFITTVYILLNGYSLEKSIIIMLISFYRLIDAYADVYESQFHKKDRLDISGKSMTFRTLLSVAIYFVVLIMTKNLVLSIIIAIIGAIAGLYIFCIRVYKKTNSEFISKAEVKKERIFKLFKSCFPLFVGVFLWAYILSASRIAIDNNMSSEFQSYFQVLFMPVSVINLLAGFIVRPLLSKLTLYYSEKRFKDFYMIIFKITALISAFTIISMVLAYLIGVWILGILVNCDLSMYRGVFTFLIMSGGINALVFIFYYVLTIFRRQRYIMISYICSAIIAVFLSDIFVKKMGINGGALSYFVVVMILAVLFVFGIVYSNRKERENG